MNYKEERPWGSFENLLDEEYCKVKRLIIKALEAKAELITLPECATSLQESSSFTKNLATSENKNISLQFLREMAKYFDHNRRA